MLTDPVTLYWHWADQLCFVVPPSSWVPCKKRSLPFLNVVGMTGTSSNRESNPQILLVSAGSPLSSPFTRGYWGPILCQGLFVCGISLTSGQLFNELFPDCTRLHQEPPPRIPTGYPLNDLVVNLHLCFLVLTTVSEWVSVGGFTPCRQLRSYSRQKQVWTYSVLVENKFGLFQVLGDRIYEMRCPFVAVGHIGPHANPPSHIILTPGRPVRFHGPYFIVSTMQAGTTPIFNVFGMTGPSSNRESNIKIFLVSAGSPLSSPFTISRGYWGPIRQEPPPRIPTGSLLW